MKVITTFKTNTINDGIQTECLALNIVYMSENTILLEARFFSDTELEYCRTIRKWKGVYYVSTTMHLKHTTFEKMVSIYTKIDHQLIEENKQLKERQKELEFMIENGLGWEDVDWNRVI